MKSAKEEIIYVCVCVCVCVCVLRERERVNYMLCLISHLKNKSLHGTESNIWDHCANRSCRHDKYTPCPHWIYKSTRHENKSNMKYGRVLLLISSYHMLKHQEEGKKAQIQMVRSYVYLFCLTSLECHKSLHVSCPYCWAKWKRRKFCNLKSEEWHFSIDYDIFISKPKTCHNCNWIHMVIMSFA